MDSLSALATAASVASSACTITRTSTTTTSPKHAAPTSTTPAATTVVHQPPSDTFHPSGHPSTTHPSFGGFNASHPPVPLSVPMALKGQTSVDQTSTDPNVQIHVPATSLVSQAPVPLLPTQQTNTPPFASGSAIASHTSTPLVAAPSSSRPLMAAPTSVPHLVPASIVVSPSTPLMAVAQPAPHHPLPASAQIQRPQEHTNVSAAVEQRATEAAPPNNFFASPKTPSQASVESENNRDSGIFVRFESLLLEKYWRNDRRNLQCFPFCPKFGDYKHHKQYVTETDTAKSYCNQPFDVAVTFADPSLSTNPALRVFGRFREVVQGQTASSAAPGGDGTSGAPAPDNNNDGLVPSVVVSNAGKEEIVLYRRGNVVPTPAKVVGSNKTLFRYRAQFLNAQNNESLFRFSPGHWKYTSKLPKTRIAILNTMHCFEIVVALEKSVGNSADSKNLHIIHVQSSAPFKIANTRSLLRMKRGSEEQQQQMASYPGDMTKRAKVDAHIAPSFARTPAAYMASHPIVNHNVVSSAGHMPPQYFGQHHHPAAMTQSMVSAANHMHPYPMNWPGHSAPMMKMQQMPTSSSAATAAFDAKSTASQKLQQQQQHQHMLQTAPVTSIPIAQPPAFMYHNPHDTQGFINMQYSFNYCPPGYTIQATHGMHQPQTNGGTAPSHQQQPVFAPTSMAQLSGKMDFQTQMKTSSPSSCHQGASVHHQQQQQQQQLEATVNSMKKENGITPNTAPVQAQLTKSPAAQVVVAPVASS